MEELSYLSWGKLTKGAPPSKACCKCNRELLSIYLVLLGMDILHNLGFCLVEGWESAARAFLGGEATMDMSSGATAEVRLIRPAHLPAGHSKIINVKVTNPDLTGNAFLFELKSKQCRGLLVPDALIGIREGAEATLVITNPGLYPMLLQEGELMGKLQECEVLQPEESETPPVVEVAAIKEGAGDSERLENLRVVCSLRPFPLP